MREGVVFVPWFREQSAIRLEGSKLICFVLSLHGLLSKVALSEGVLVTVLISVADYLTEVI